ncbi:hypothetical protein LOC54_00625 [Acetobacter sp. AN02]|uniref:hypothetical protein n=1 Tax=Acetobacter sp. AN02 TaxID=2894186 RepID=UPI002434296B|nr:hypothetical protein [Acetobacter sp. AN02]MDG6093629.1 hypothetical protein [Acetobacter sp. AN02]
MRSIHGQLSDNQPIRRSLAEKQKQLRDLKETLATMKSHTSPALRDSVKKRITQLQAELSAAPVLKTGPKDKPREASPGTSQDRPRRQGSRIRALTTF